MLGWLWLGLRRDGLVQLEDAGLGKNALLNRSQLDRCRERNLVASTVVASKFGKYAPVNQVASFARLKSGLSPSQWQFTQSRRAGNRPSAHP